MTDHTVIRCGTLPAKFGGVLGLLVIRLMEAAELRTYDTFADNNRQREVLLFSHIHIDIHTYIHAFI